MTQCEITKHWLYEIAEEVVRSYDACQTILNKDLGMRLVLPKSIPQLLAVPVCGFWHADMCSNQQDEIWVCSYNI